MAGHRKMLVRPPSGPPADVREGEARIRQSAVELFGRHDGEAADWKLMTESLFRAAFVVLDKLPEEERRAIARRVHSGSYDRITGGSMDVAGAAGTGVFVSAPSNTPGGKAPDLRPPR